MINYIISSDPSILDVSTYNTGPYTSGAVYWDSNARQYKIIDANGSAVSMPQSSANVNIGPKLREMITWFEHKKLEEQKIAKLCEEYPNLAEAKKEFDALYNIVKEHNDSI